MPDTEKKPKNRRNLVIGLALLFLLVSTGGIFIFVTQKEQIADLRNWAAGPPGPYPGVKDRASCIKAGGDVVTEPGKECGCGGYRVECVINGKYYKIGCEQNPNADCGGGDKDKPTKTPTPTTTTTPTQTPTSTPTGTPTGTPTETPTQTPTGTPGPTNTVTPTPTTQMVYAPPAPSTPNIPVAGTGPSVLGVSVIAIGFLSLLLGLLF